MSEQGIPRRPVVITPLAGSQETDGSYALGALLSKLLGEHLGATGLPVVDQRVLVRYMVLQKHRLPLDEAEVEALHAHFKPHGVVHGRYVLDDDGKLFGVRLQVDRPDVEAPPLEASTPLAAFPRFVEHISLALIEALGVPIGESLRKRIKGLPRPEQFEAFRQVAQAQAAWSRGQHELALAAATSALAIDDLYEEALEVQIAAARAARDAETVRSAFQKWSSVAVKRGRPHDGAERLMLLGHWLRDRGEWADARRAYDAARSLFEREKDEVGSARAQNNAANLDLISGKTQAAIKTYRRSLRVFETHANVQADSAAALLNLSLAHKQLGQREEALIAVEQAITLARGLKDTQLEARCLAGRGAVRHDMSQWARAEEDYSRAIRLLDVVGDEAGIAVVKSYQALLLKQRGDYQRAESLFLGALEGFKRHPQAHEQAVMWLNLADLYFAMQMYEQAWEYAERAGRVFEQLNSDDAEQAHALLRTLERVAVPGDADAVPGEETTGQDPLYNGTELYHNEYEDKNSGDSDAGVNSGVGRTPMM